ncbi:transketolase [Micromonospora sp. WMMD980]|uniref:transketolase n=1 Tax=Micromonospora sp. WMMD980 TaxID=3016088 RepID=UPI0024161832|nr:transketolase [Micromonospora sp. WMMD980]MDG4800725.1 transketolase [Micromonospora sp. WMMD980]
MTLQAQRTLRDEDLTGLAELAAQLRVDAIRCSTMAGSGHPTSSLSAADLLAVLVARHLRYDWSFPGNPGNDHLIFSKGHASPLLYAVFRAVGAISEQELLETYRRADSRLQGHPTPVLPWVDVATGSLGQGLPVGVGVALAAQYLDRSPAHVWVLCGDSETAEGSVWEALDKAGHYGLRNLTAIVDVNRLGQRGPTELGWDLDTYRRRVEAFGCRAIVVDGHDLGAVDEAYEQARHATGPTVVLARTVKGRGVPEIEDDPSWHGKALDPDLADRAVRALGGPRRIRVAGPRPFAVPRTEPVEHRRPELPRYERGAKVATRDAYGDALRALGAARPDVVALDGEVGDSTRADRFGEAYPDRYFQMSIAEQQLVAAAVGLAVRGRRPFAATFAAFWSRAYDFIRMAGVSRADIALVGSHAGVEIGPDGPSQMGLEDVAALRAVPGSTVLCPADAVSCAALVAQLPDRPGVAYLRTTRGAYPVLYDDGEAFPIGGSRVVREGGDIALLGAGVTVHVCLAAADELTREGIAARVVDLYSIKPVDRERLREAVRDTGGRLVVVEDHYPEGGLGSAVLEALADLAEPVRVQHLAVRGLPGSGTPAQQLDRAGIGRHAVVAAARALA